MISPEDSHSDDDVKVDDNNCEDEDDTPPKLTAQAQGELSDGAYSPRGADTPTQDLISQIERHCDGYGEKNTDQDSFIHVADISQLSTTINKAVREKTTC